MAKRTVEESSLILVADSIRAKAGKSDKLEFPSGFKSAIDGITKSEIKNQDITIKENGTYTPASGFTGFGSVKVEVKSSGGSGGDLPAAEESIFGVIPMEGEYGLMSASGLSYSGYAGGDKARGIKFTPAEPFAVTGFRYYTTGDVSIWSGVRLWDSDENLLATSPKPQSDVANEWQTLMLDTPVNVVAGKAYTAAIDTRGEISCTKFTINPKLSNVVGVYGSESRMPTFEEQYILGVVDLIISPAPAAPAPNSYEIQLSTITDIAKEAQRISGETRQLSTTEIIAILQGVETPTA